MVHPLRKTLWGTLALCGFAALVLPLTARATTSSCSDYAKIGASPYYVYNNTWNLGNAGSGYWECVYSNGLSGGSVSWGTSYYFPDVNPYDVKSYPSIVLGWQYGYTYSNTGLPVKISAGDNIESSLQWSENGTNTGNVDVSYDNWIISSTNASSPTAEMMIWCYNDIGGQYGEQEGSVTIDGISWTFVYRPVNYNGTGNGWPVFSFVSNSNKSSNQTINLKDFLNYITYTKGLLNSGLYLGGVEFGTEVFYNTNSKDSGALNVQKFNAVVN